MILSKQSKFPQLATETQCTGCLACEAVCKADAIKSYIAADGHVYINLDTNKCVKCLKCEIVCNKSRSNYGDNLLKNSNIYGGWNNDITERARGTSGGVFAAFARIIIENGGCVVGASFDGKKCNHIIIENIDDIKKLQGSKYMVSSLSGIYRKIEKQLETRDVLFSGLGCQCAGILAYFSLKKYNHKLYTIDLVCGGIPSSILVDKFYEKNPQIECIHGFRKKDTYCLTIGIAGKQTTYLEKNLPLHGFNCGLTNRYSCYNCPFAKAHRKTDITIGDLWDYKLFPNEHKLGVSTIIVHNESGEQLIKKANITYESIPWEGPLLHCKRIVDGYQHLFLPRKYLAHAASTMSYEKFVKLFCINMHPINILLYSFRIYRFFVMKIDSFISLKKIKHLLRKQSMNLDTREEKNV